MFSNIQIGQTFKDYYKDKPKRPRYVFLGFILLIILFWFIAFKNDTVEYSAGTFSFAGQDVPFGGRYFFNQERLDREIAITRLNVEQFVMIYRRWDRYMPYIEQELKKYGVPQDFKYLPVIESALRYNVVSSAGAVGLRQLMPDTAQRYGLRVDDQIDERYDRQKSTDAAIRYIRYMFDNEFKDRTLVAAAYNRGENGLQRDMDWQKATGYYDLLLNDETARYVFRIVAMKDVFENRAIYFDTNVLGNMYTNPKTKTIRLQAMTGLTDRAVANGYSYLEIKQLNPRLRTNEIPEEGLEIKVFK